MTIFVDGDAFPNLLKPIVVRAVERVQVPLVLVSNKPVRLGDSSLIETVIVEAGADAADDRIVEMLSPGDLVITADIPLADRVLSKKAHAIDHRGERYTPDNIKQYLAMRNLMETIRDSGVVTGGPKPFGPKDVHAFANALHRFLTEHVKA
ncbi:YaiI/YqxD family protein [Sulfurimonas sp. HSL-1656]|uniref:YaiI/YqxD family protein n=1 Tax=Thiomicrolovo subterrani TaxID=3131934 RepID=UPI0031F9B278